MVPFFNFQEKLCGNKNHMVGFRPGLQKPSGGTRIFFLRGASRGKNAILREQKSKKKC